MEACFRSLKAKLNLLNQRRQGHYFGIVVEDPEDPLTNLRFADDVLLFAHSAKDVAKMIAHMQEEAAKYGLVLNMEKTKVLTTSSSRPGSEISIGAGKVKILDADESERYLGRKVCMEDYHQTELNHRIAAGWCAFAKLKFILCSKSYELRLRIKLFESVVTPSVLYGCAAWTMTMEAEQMLKSTRRRMLRWMTGVSRTTDEDWVTYVRRATHHREALATAHAAQDWVDLQRKRKWKLAGQTARQSDDRWSKRLLTWQPWFRSAPRRNVGHPRKRWDDGIVNLAGKAWTEEAADMTRWNALEAGYIDEQI